MLVSFTDAFDRFQNKAALFTNMVCSGESLNRRGNMKRKDGESRTPKAQGALPVRASISFPAEIYQCIGEIARRKKVSVAWVVREAWKNTLRTKWPLFPSRNKPMNFWSRSLSSSSRRPSNSLLNLGHRKDSLPISNGTSLPQEFEHKNLHFF